MRSLSLGNACTVTDEGNAKEEASTTVALVVPVNRVGIGALAGFAI
jgi:hypothetical protein